jgi:hypothetical protein
MLLQAGRPRTSVASISVRNDRTFVQSMLTTSGRFFQYRRWRTSQRSGPCMASEMWMRSLLVNRRARLMQCLAVLQVLAARRRPSSAKLTHWIGRTAVTQPTSVFFWPRLQPAR